MTCLPAEALSPSLLRVPRERYAGRAGCLLQRHSKTGAVVVTEELCTGSRHYSQLVDESTRSPGHDRRHHRQVFGYQLRLLHPQRGTHQQCAAPGQGVPGGQHHPVQPATPHLLRNTSDSDFRSLVVKTPRQKNPRCCCSCCASALSSFAAPFSRRDEENTEHEGSVCCRPSHLQDPGDEAGQSLSAPRWTRTGRNRG